MVATMIVKVDYGGTADAPGTEQDTSALSPNVRMKTVDNNTIDTNNPIPIPTDTSINRSFWKSVYMLCSTAPDTQIDNVKFYTDGAGFGSGIGMWVGAETPTKTAASDAGYDPAVGTTGETGTIMTSHTDITGTADAFSFTSGSPKTVSISESGNVIDAKGETTDYLVFQMYVASNASSGNLADETFTFRYDEI